MSIQFKIYLFVCGLIALILSSTANASTFFIKVTDCSVIYASVRDDVCGGRFRVGVGNRKLKVYQSAINDSNVVKAALTVGGALFNTAKQQFSLTCGDNEAEKNTIGLTAETELLRNTITATIECTQKSNNREDTSDGAEELRNPNKKCNKRKKQCLKHVQWADEWDSDSHNGGNWRR